MGRTIGILQPGYLPWLGFFEQLARADVFVVYDDVQFEKGGWRNRNRIKTPQGAQWLSVPVLTKNEGFPLIRDVCINRKEAWGGKHVKSLRQNYGKAPYFQDYAPELFSILERDWDRLHDLNLELIGWLAGKMGIATEMVLASELDIPGVRTERLIRIIRHLGGDAFYEGAAGKNYIDPQEFLDQGITVIFQDYMHPVYPQLYGDFISHLSVVDLLFNCGPESRDILLRQNTTRDT